VDKVVSDTDLKANEALTYLYGKGFDETFLHKILSIGTVGLKISRKLVPTRWSITAVDDTLGKDLIKTIKEYNTTDYMAFSGGYLGNYYLILCFPEPWSYELFEMYAKPNPEFMTDYESYDGRKQYASETVGGYYAARLGILEKLASLKKQASVLALRFITSEYSMPLGVWVVREATRNTMNQPPIAFSSKELMLEYAKKFVKRKFNVDLEDIFRRSKLLQSIKYQNKLVHYL